MKKQFISWADPFLDKEDEKNVVKALRSTWISGGDYVQKFEKKISNLIDSKFSISVNNGTSAIHLVYLALGLKPGDEIIIPGFGYLAASNVALQMGLVPVFADVDIDSFCISAENIIRKITKKTKLIIVINTYGNIFEIEIVAFNAGLHMLREDTSPVLDRVKSFSASIPDLRFSACQNTINGMTKKEGKAPDLVDSAVVVPGGVGRLMKLDDSGYFVIRP